MQSAPVELNGNRYLIKVYFEHRHDSAVSIGKTAINIRIPDFLNRDEKARELLRMKMWAIGKIKEKPERFKPEPQKGYKDGELLKIGNEEYTLKICYKDKQSSSAKLNGSIIELSIMSQLPKEKRDKHASSLLSRIIAAKRLPELEKKLHELNEKHFNQKINRVFFKNIKSRWGSCSEAGNINISTRLLFAPDNVLESVCIHELAHLIEQNHSERFWALVEKAMPDYKEAHGWLKENGGSCGF